MGLIKSVSGVRGIVRAAESDTITMDAQVARRLGRAYATYLLRQIAPRDATRRLVADRSVLVGGRDGRAGGEVLLSAFADGARASGVDVLDIGIVSTPGVAMIVKVCGAAGGVVITASHNPAQWNGVKFITSQGRAPTRRAAEAIFNIFDRGKFDDVRVNPRDATRGLVSFDPHRQHVDAVLRTIDLDRIRQRAFSVVLDSINGAGAVAGRLLLDSLGCRVVHLNAEPAATFAHTPEPTAENLVDLCARVRAEHADIGFGQDPDADRVAIVDEHGRYIGEEYSLALAAKRVFQTSPGPAATNLSTSRLIDDIAAPFGGLCRVYRSAVGEANVVDMMMEHGCVIGGEGNGGVIDPRVVQVRDSLVGIGLVLDLLAAEGRAVSQVIGGMQPYAMIKDKLACDRERIAPALAAVRQAFPNEVLNDIDGVRVDWPDERKWVHLRGSNTEPVLRIIVEAATDAAAEELMHRVRQIVAPLG